MTSRLVLLSGIPGSGKSRYVAERFGVPCFYGSVRGFTPAGSSPAVEVISADALFVGEDGVYRHDPSRLGEAHNKCVASAAFWAVSSDDDPANRVVAPADVLVVDNTNTTALELAPYVALAAAFGIPCSLVTVECDPETAFARNAHGAPRETVLAMHAALQARVLPPYWDLARETYVASG